MSSPITARLAAWLSAHGSSNCTTPIQAKPTAAPAPNVRRAQACPLESRTGGIFPSDTRTRPRMSSPASASIPPVASSMGTSPPFTKSCMMALQVRDLSSLPRAATSAA